jgi:hypothetical protein
MATEVIAEEIATNLEEVAEVTRKIGNAAGIGYFGIGLIIGAGIGFYYGHKHLKEKLRAEAFEESKIEVEQIREAYSARAVVKEKPGTPEEIVKEQGYEGPPVAAGADATVTRLKASVPVQEPIQYHRAPPPQEPAKPVHDPQWNFEEELAKRVPGEPHVIHEDEYHETEDGLPRPGWTQTAMTYYARDDVLTNERDEVVPNADEVIGQYNLRFGVGSTDPDLVFIRNPDRMLEMEITRVDKSYEEHVLGFDSHEEG